MGRRDIARIPPYRWDQIALASVIAGAVLRAAWTLALHPPLNYVFSDMKFYVDRAINLAQGGALERFDAFYPPGTHWILALPFAIFGTDRTGLWSGAVLWWALSAFTPLAMWRFARYHLTIPAAAITAALVSFSPLHILYAGYFLSETPALALLVGSLWLADRAAAARRSRSFLGAGLLGGLAIANRPALVANVVIAALAAPRAMRVRAIALISLGAAAVIALVVIHNTAAAGRLTLISENSGLTFWSGQCDVRLAKLGNPATGPYYEFGSPPAIQRASGSTEVIPDHLPWDQEFFYARAFDCIRQRGPGELRWVARGIFDMTLTSVPFPTIVEGDLGDRVAFVNAMFSVALPFLLWGAVWLIRLRRRRGEGAGELLMLAHFACLLLYAVIFTGDPRYRIPYDVFALALAGALAAYFFVERPTERSETAPDTAG